MFIPKQLSPGKPVLIRLPLPPELMETAKHLSEVSGTRVQAVLLQAIEYAFQSRDVPRSRKSKKAE